MEYIAELRARHGDQIIARQQKRVLSPRIAADPIVCPVEPLTVILQNQTLFGPENIAHRTPTPAGSLDALGEVNGLVQATAPQTQTTSREEINAKAASSVSIGDADFAITCRTARLAN